jgi:di/tripeptidase
MTKLEELTALLVNEINDFKNGVEKLEKIREQINTTKIKMDITEYKLLIETHKQQMESHKDTLERFESRFNAKIEQAKIYPTWAVVVFIICVLLTLLFITVVFLK